MLRLAVVLLALCRVRPESGAGAQRSCVKSTTSVSRIADDEEGTAAVGDAGLGVDRCDDESGHCYTLWTEHANGTQTVMGQGCWKVSSEPHDCERGRCVADSRSALQPPPLPPTSFCCCHGDMCNANFTAAAAAPPGGPPPPPRGDDRRPPRRPLRPLVWIASGVFSALSMLAVGAICLCWDTRRPKKADVELGGRPQPSSPDCGLDKLVLVKNIGQGRYGSVWRGLSGDREVAVKVFPAHHRTYYANEREMYREARRHRHLLRCLGGGERAGAAGHVDYVLVLGLERECLQEHLRRATLDLAALCRMGLSVASGLAHLHSDGRGKPCVAHRDLNTRNVLVRRDLTCCICDLEFYREARRHRHLLHCLGGGERAGAAGHVDYVLVLGLERECLQEHLRRATLDLAALCRMGLSVASGLAHLHSDGRGKPCVAHRDLNTRNVLVRRDLTCCICDLGLAVVPRRTENRSLSEAGTLRYMAPEVLEGAVNLRDRETALKQIDVYALGLVLWELGTRCADLQLAEPPPYGPPFHREAGDSPTLEQMQALVSRRKARPLWPEAWRDTAAARLLCETAEDCWDQDAEARLTSLCVEERFLELPTLRARPAAASPAPAPPPKDSNRLAGGGRPAAQPYQGRNPCLERNLLSASGGSGSAESVLLLVDRSSKHLGGGGSGGSGGSESQNLIANDYLSCGGRRAAPIPYVRNAVRGPHEEEDGGRGEKAAGRRLRWFGRLFAGGADRRRPKDSPQVTVVKSTNGGGAATSLLRPSALPPRPSTAAGGSSPERRRSLERFAEVFAPAAGAARLRDPALRVKTPGDVPPSVRRTRGRAARESAARFSLYDDRMMAAGGQWGSAPDLEPPGGAAATGDVYDRDSVSSF